MVKCDLTSFNFHQTLPDLHTVWNHCRPMQPPVPFAGSYTHKRVKMKWILGHEATKSLHYNHYTISKWSTRPGGGHIARAEVTKLRPISFHYNGLLLGQWLFTERYTIAITPLRMQSPVLFSIPVAECTSGVSRVTKICSLIFFKRKHTGQPRYNATQSWAALSVVILTWCCIYYRLVETKTWCRKRSSGLYHVMTIEGVIAARDVLAHWRATQKPDFPASYSVLGHKWIALYWSWPVLYKFFRENACAYVSTNALKHECPVM